MIFRQFASCLVALLAAVLLGASPVLAASPAVLPGLGGLFTGTPPQDLGVQAGQLQGCPPSPNCVSTSDTDEEHGIAPITYSADADAVQAKLVEVLNNQPRTEIVEATDDYLRVEFTSRLMGFVDDAEFYFPADAQEIRMRSAARLGESDLGVNRRRLEQFRLALQNLGA